MRFFATTRILVWILFTGLCLQAQTREAAPEAKGIPPRATPADYQSHAQAGTITIAAEFTGHSLPTLEGPLTTEEYVAVEVALFGPAGAALKISTDNFSLKVNGKKSALPGLPYGVTFSSLKDPEWIPPEPPEKKSKSSMGTGGQGGGANDPPPLPPKMTVKELRALGLRVQKAALPEGDRALPQAGLLFFQYRGKNIQSVELLYDGPAGKASLNLQP